MQSFKKDVEGQLNTLATTIQSIKATYDYSARTNQEILWANIFNNTIDGCPWLHDKRFSPGRWAAGYSYLYILYRVLNILTPQRILEFGLGETTKLIAQYAAAYGSVEHYVVEHDPKWIDLFKAGNNIPQNTEIVQLPLSFKEYKDCASVRVYESFAERLAKGRYDLVCIDGPFGGDMKNYSRIDTLSLIPKNISESFVIIMDDYNRIQEQNTVKEILNSLNNPVAGVYSGQKDTCLICSADLRFLASL